MTTSQTPLKYLQEDDLSEECKKLVSNLSKEKGWIASYYYNYQGFWLAPRAIQGVIACQQQFQAQDSDIILVTTPKARTTWLKSLLFVLVNRKKHPIFNQNHPLFVKTPHDLVPFLERDLYRNGQVSDFSSFTSPRLFSTHLPYASLPKSVQDSRTKLVYLCRNPRDTFISMWHFANTVKHNHTDTNSIEEVFDLFCKGVTVYGPFWNHVFDSWKQSIEKPNKVLFLMYEEIKAQPKIQLKRLSEFLECPFSVEEENSGVMDEILRMCSFENLTNLEVNTNGKSSLSGTENKIFFRKGEVGDWKNYFTTEMIEKLNHVIEQKLQGSGLRFLYI
ncbi:cytosolic sulfotransferase 12 isoform X2 [Capsicum annuum]|uniref:cytosolic sulfotransferase 12 isoform X1 n=1 Tax=Capsicum annuum TaxID=4072 RepID=UPI001FB11D1B|nr:cytosolic sulfotransferase 12 isoform X1 [Capsicum annuum]XP_047255440.1 cytosolic sulfotransferase 12 isoform X2 [Capsicum annuum]